MLNVLGETEGAITHSILDFRRHLGLHLGGETTPDLGIIWSHCRDPQKHFSVLVKTNVIKHIIFISCCFQNHIKSIYGPYMGHPRSPNWTLDFEPAFSPRFSPTLSPRSIFQTRQRFPISNHVTSGSMSPRSYFTPWSAVSHTGSSSGHVIALGQSGASIYAQRAHLTTNVCNIFIYSL